MNKQPVVNPSLRNQQEWDRLYKSTDSLIWGSQPLPFVTSFIDKNLHSFNENTKILDAATGEGRNLSVLENLCAQLFACDSSYCALKKINKNTNKMPNLALCDLRKTPYKDYSFNYIFLTDTIETLLDLNSVFSELYRILSIDGMILCNIPGMEDGISSIDMTPLGEKQFLYKDKFFYHFYDEEKSLKLFHKHSLNTIYNEINTWEEAPHPNFRDKIHTHTSRIFVLQK